MNMPQGHVIHLSNHFITVYAVERRRVTEQLRLSTQDLELAKFDHFLAELGQNPVRLVVDLKEELIHYETVPHLTGSDRKALLDRKIRQIAGDSKFRSVLALGREQGGRKDDRILICAIPQTDTLQPWLDSLFRHRIPIHGMYSTAVICEQIVKNLVNDPDILLVSTSANRGGKLSVRQSFYRDRKLILSRLSLTKKSDSMISDVFKEINRTRSYLLRAHSLNHDKALTVLFVTDAENVVDANAQRAELIQTQLNVYAYGEFSREVGLVTPPESADFDAIVAHQAAQLSRFKTQYRTQDTRFYYWHHRAKQSMQVASVFFLLGAVSYASACWFDIQQTKFEIDDIQVEWGQIQSTLNNTPRSELIHGYTPEQIENYMRTEQILRSKLVHPDVVLDSISASLAGNSAIQLNSVDWSREPDSDSDQSFNSESVISNIGEDGQSLVADQSARKSAVYAKISGEIIPFDGNYRNAHQHIEALVAALKRQPSVQSASATQLPMDTRPTVDITGEMRPAENLQDSATFTVEAIIDYRKGTP